ncbi:MAG: GHKL domain-containing protein [Ignavibacteriaceae bacterium]|nr:GHKL domain-containing protein [Ignavibacteriaceae bacterium]
MRDGIISTIPDRCQRCYSCIRECPAKAIKVVSGQAVVLEERCIACGHCVKVCSQDAKNIKSDLGFVISLLSAQPDVYAIVAPSFAASFPADYRHIPASLKKLGFSQVIETAFGADLISTVYAQDFEKINGKPVISSSCPAVYNFIRKYHTELVDNIAPIVSPMVALGRYIKANFGEDKKVVFIGPCIAKKSEILDEETGGVIDAVLTFTELKDFFAIKEIIPGDEAIIPFDPPHAYMGKSYPLAGGLLKTADISDDILQKQVIVVEGKSKVVEIVEELAENHIDARFIDILFCEGCISGPAIDSHLNYYSRRQKVIEFVEESLNRTDKAVWKSDLYNNRNLNLRRSFKAENQRRPMPSEEEIKEILRQINKTNDKDELNCGACGYPTCREFAITVAKGLAEKEMCLPFLIDELENAYNSLRTTQEQLHSAEKLASIGQLAAGVAHEINNPLSTIMLYASLVKDDIKEIKAESSDDLSLIINEANRCKNIVSNLLNFARQGKLNIDKFNLQNIIVDIIQKLNVRPEFKQIRKEFIVDLEDFIVSGDKEQLEQVFSNIIQNACESMEDSEVKKLAIKVYTNDTHWCVDIQDSGCGIEKGNEGKVFTPFFTTKKMGKGTGLGLAIAYGIIKMHKGEIYFRSNEGSGTLFTVKIPRTIGNFTA